jgi:menaquinol-cytochrome c reductase iron-sulfur subunit
MALQRREALKRVVAGLSGVVAGLLVGIPGLRAFVAPAFKRKGAENWVKLGPTDEFDVDIPTKVDFVQSIRDAWVEDRALRNVWVYTEDGETFTVFSGRCTHLGCGFAFDEEKQQFHCPCHHGLFDAKTGEVVGGPPPRPLDTLRTKIQGGDLYADYRLFRVGVPEKVEG